MLCMLCLIFPFDVMHGVLVFDVVVGVGVVYGFPVLFVLPYRNKKRCVPSVSIR